MKNLIATLIFLLTCLGAVAQTASVQSYFWTNGITIVTNFQVGAVSIPLATNHMEAINWLCDQWNAQYKLTGTNQFKAKDIVAWGMWRMGEEYNAQRISAIQSAADAKASIRRIKEALNYNSVSDADLAAIIAILKL